jgi:hypothetical protein
VCENVEGELQEIYNRLAGHFCTVKESRDEGLQTETNDFDKGVCESGRFPLDDGDNNGPAESGSENGKTIAKRRVWSALNSGVSDGGRTSCVNAAIKNVVDRQYIVSVLHLDLPSDAFAHLTEATAFFLDSSWTAG